MKTAAAAVRAWAAARLSEAYSGVIFGREYPPGFTDGRHRYSVLRDEGLRFLPVTVDPADFDRFRERFEYRGPMPKGRRRKAETSAD